MKATAQFFNAAPDTEVVFANEFILGDDGWVQLSPFGDFPGVAFTPKPDGSFEKKLAVQRYDLAGAAEMVRRFRSPLGKLKRFLLGGVEIFNGHPDMPDGRRLYPDPLPKGIIADLAVRANGLYCLPVFNNAGLELLAAGGKLGFSGRVGSSFIGEENDVEVFRPDFLKSVGLAPRPNLPVEFLNAFVDEPPQTPEPKPQNQTDPMKEKLIAALKKAGILAADFANDTADDAVLSKFEEALAQRATFANDKSALESSLTTERATLNSKDTAITALTGERDTARAEFANERTARIDLVVEDRVKAGAITEAERALWANRLKADFANESTALLALKPGSALKTDSKTGNLGDRKVEFANAQARMDRVQQLVAEKMKQPEFANSYDAAFAAVEREQPELFRQMQPAK